jgi:hypothetical protein
VDVFVATQTSSVSAPDATWVTVPGATVTFTTTGTRVVDIEADGSITPSGSGSTYTHCGIRFVVDGNGQGDASWGDRLLGCGGSGHPGWWCSWSARRRITLVAGSHTVAVQLKGWTTGYMGCAMDAAPYSATKLWVLVR